MQSPPSEETAAYVTPHDGRQTDRRTDRWTDGQIDRQRQTDTDGWISEAGSELQIDLWFSMCRRNKGNKIKIKDSGVSVENVKIDRRLRARRVANKESHEEEGNHKE